MSDWIDDYRAEYRRTEIPAWYRGWLHFAFTTGATSAVILYSALQLHGVQGWEWLTVPVTFFFSNLVEHFGHRNPMHHPVRGLGLLFRRHSGQHHRFFTHERMAIDGTADFKVTLFPPAMFAFFFGGFALPAGLLLWWLATANVAYLFVITGVGYFLNYELLHFAYHMPEDSRVFRIPGLRFLRRHHQAHHNPALMTRCNFNITYPIADLLHGTYYRGPHAKTGR